eukprot:SAG22_NODE_6183_length_889_cov_1.167089_1_plen_82_part_10
MHLAGKVHGKALALLQSLGSALPPSIALHSYGGAPEMVPRFLALPAKVFFGFSSRMSCHDPPARAARARACMVLIPPDRLLV